jgi:hypothetical protein
MSIQKIIDHLKTIYPDDFNMRNPIFDLGPCCIGAHAVHILNDQNYRTTIRALVELCKISVDDAGSICYPPNKINDKSVYNATVDQAISLLEHYRDTGIVDWERVIG